MSIQTELSRIINAKASIKAAIEGKGVTVPDGTLLDGMAALIDSIETGSGGRKILEGSFVPSSDVTKFTITHDFGVIPSFACWFLSDKNSAGFNESDALIGVAFRDITTQLLVSSEFNTTSSYVSSFSGHFNTSFAITYKIAGNNYAWAKATINKITANTNSCGYFRAGKTYQYILIGD